MQQRAKKQQAYSQDKKKDKDRERQQRPSDQQVVDRRQPSAKHKSIPK